MRSARSGAQPDFTNATQPGSSGYRVGRRRVRLNQVMLQFPGNQHPLNLARTLIDLRNPRLAGLALPQVVLQVAIAAMDLHCLGADFLGHFRGEQLGLGGF